MVAGATAVVFLAAGFVTAFVTAGFLVEVFLTTFFEVVFFAVVAGAVTGAFVVVVVAAGAAGFVSARAEPAIRIAAVISVVIVFIAVLLVFL